MSSITGFAFSNRSTHLYLFDPTTYELNGTVSLSYKGAEAVVNNAKTKMYFVDGRVHVGCYDILAGTTTYLSVGSDGSKFVSHCVISPDDTRLYVSNDNSNGATSSIIVVDTASFTVINELLLSVASAYADHASVPVCTNTRLYVPLDGVISGGGLSPAFAEYDVSNYSLLRVVSLPLKRARVALLSPGNDTLYLVTTNDGSLYLSGIVAYNLGTDTVSSSVALGVAPYAVYSTLLGDGSKIFTSGVVTGPSDRHLCVFAVTTDGGLTLAATIFAPTIGASTQFGQAYAVVPGITDDAVWVVPGYQSPSVSGSPTLVSPYRIDTATYEVTNPIAPATFNSDVINWVSFVCVPPSVSPVLTVVPRGQRNDVSWTAISGTTSYILKYSTTSGGPYSTVTTATGTSYTHRYLDNGTLYYYVVTAANACGSTTSAEASGRPDCCKNEFTASSPPTSAFTASSAPSGTFASSAAPAGSFASSSTPVGAYASSSTPTGTFEDSGCPG